MSALLNILGRTMDSKRMIFICLIHTLPSKATLLDDL